MYVQLSQTWYPKNDIRTKLDQIGAFVGKWLQSFLFK